MNVVVSLDDLQQLVGRETMAAEAVQSMTAKA